MTRINFNEQSRLFEIIELKSGKVLSTSTGHDAAMRIMDKWDDRLENNVPNE